MSLILFDAGNTLLWLDHPYLVEALAAHGVRTTEAELLRAEYAAKRLVDELARAHSGDDNDSRGRIYFAEIFRQVGVPESEMGNLAAQLYLRHAEKNLWSNVRPGTAEALKRLGEIGYRMGVVSNADGRVEALLDEVGLGSFFDVVIDSQVVGVEKPDPRIFQLACARAGFSTLDTMYVGDIYEIDVVGARGVGMRAFLVDPLDLWGELDCERIRGVDELPERLMAEAGGDA
jgi:putative hydrolase of the HAD superfamily